MNNRQCFWAAILGCVLVGSTMLTSEADERPILCLSGGYAIVVSQETAKATGWGEVLEALRAKYDAQVVFYETGKVEDALPALREKHPRYVCFLAQPKEATGDFVARVHRLTRTLDDDPWTDCIWAILTGYNAADAMKIVKEEPLEIRRVLGGTPLQLACADSGVWFSELKQNEKWVKESGKEPVQVAGPNDTTEAIITELVQGKAQLFITSGHATQKDWQIGFSYRNGYFISQPGGKLAGRDTAGTLHEIVSDEPRVHLGVGNCLIGDISDVDNCMALGLMHSAGVRQMVGYTELTWYGYMGWGMLDYFYLQPGRYTVAEAFFANQQALLHRLETVSPGVNAAYNLALQAGTAQNFRAALSPAGLRLNLRAQDITGLLHDRDSVAIYGDPAWIARMAEGQNEWTQTVQEKRSLENPQEITYAIILRKTGHDNTDTNGSQRGGRPFVVFLPTRLAQNADGTVEVTIIAGAELSPVIADDFVLIPKFEMAEGKEYMLTFRAIARSE
ncbi:MAG: hypothetical protein FWE95_10455 [Planctomycetaceae bacterium]|nr:hypothetical protein [Planctomycetaceae bacterium]